MKILIINKFHYMRGGSETYHFALAEALKAKGHEVVFFAMKDERNIPCEQEEYFAPNLDFNNSRGIIKKLRIAKQFVYSKEAADNLKRLIEKENIDIAHIGLIHRQLTFSIVDELRLHSIPIVMTMHDLIFACPNYMMLSKRKVCEKCINGSILNCIVNKCVKGSYVKSMLGAYEKRYLKSKKYYEKIDLYIAECELYRKLMIQSGFDENSIVKIHNFLPISEEYRYEKESTDYVLFFGRFSEEKGIITLLKAHKENQCKFPLMLVGDGPYKVAIEEYIKENKLSNIEMPGAIYGEKMDEILNKARVVIIPSEWYENCPYALLQAAAKGKIVIASKIGGLGELISDGENGYLYEAGNYERLAEKINHVMNMPQAKFDALSEFIASDAEEKYSWETYIDTLCAQYERLIDNKNA